MEGRPVSPDPTHRYEVTCGWGEGVGVEEQRVHMVLVSVANIQIYIYFLHSRAGRGLNLQGERDLNPRPEGLVLQPVSSLHHGDLSGEEDGGALGDSHRGGHLAVVWV